MTVKSGKSCAVSALFALAWLAVGCGGPPPASTQAMPIQAHEEPAIVDLTDPTKPVPLERFPGPESARIAPGDLLELRVLGFPELSGMFLVAQDGRINLSLIGGVQASGKTAEELDRDITNAFSVYYRNLDIAVNVNTHTSRYVYVFGVVTKAGRYDFASGERVLHAIAQAGGYAEGARESDIVLMRREEDGIDHAYRLDFSHIHTQQAPRDIYLQPGDVVFVPKSRLKTAYDFSYNLIDTLGRTATTALVANELKTRAAAISIAH